MLLRRRAQELVSLSEKTKMELQHKEEMPTGEIAIGCGETKSMAALSEKMVSFRQKYPLVQFSIYSAIADDIKERLEKGLLDMGLLVEPVDISKYEFIRSKNSGAYWCEPILHWLRKNLSRRRTCVAFRCSWCAENR